MKAKGIAVAWCALALGAAAAEGPGEEQRFADAFGAVRPTEPSDVTGADYLRPAGVLLVIAGMAGGLVVMGRRFGVKRPFLRGRNLKVLETAYISPRHSLALVRVRNRVLVLGMGQDVRMLASFVRPEEVLGFDGEFSREFRDALSEGPSAAAEPVSRLRKAVGRWRTNLRGIGRERADAAPDEPLAAQGALGAPGGARARGAAAPALRREVRA